MSLLHRFCLIVLLIWFQGSLISQEINRDPEKRKDYANVYFKPKYTLFDLRSDEPIFPKEDGKYHIYYASNEVKTPKSFVGSASELAGLYQYKFKDFESCKLWCDGIPYGGSSSERSSPSKVTHTNNVDNSNRQVLKRDPRANKSYVNRSFDPKFTLFDLWSDEPIFPEKDGRYHIYVANEQTLTPQAFVGTANEVANRGWYKFSNLETCKLWCQGIPFNIHTQKKYASILSEKKYGVEQEEIKPSPLLPATIDSVFNFLVTMGKGWSKPLTQYNTSGVHNQFSFGENGGPLIENKDLAEINKSTNGFNFKENFDFFLMGLDSLNARISNLENELMNYDFPNCENNLNYTGWGREHWSLEQIYARMMASGKIFILNNTSDPVKYALKLFKLCKKHERWDIASSLNKCENTVYIYYGLNESNISTNIYGNYGQMSHLEPCKKFNRKLNKEIKKRKLVRVGENDKEKFIKSITGLDKRYFQLLADIKNFNEVKQMALNSFFKKLDASANFNNFSYWGSLKDGLPNGYGILLSQNNKLLLSAQWIDGIPTRVYSLNNYHGVKSEWDKQWYRYLIKNGEGKCKNLMIDLSPVTYSGADLSSFQIYIGEYNENYIGEKMGFGTLFFNQWEKSDLKFYSGDWMAGKFNGDGIMYDKGYQYYGKFENDKIKNGKCIWPDNTSYTGDFLDSKMHGFGTLTYPNGEIKNGYFENNVYVKSWEQYQRELEEKRLQEEKILAEQAEAERKQKEIELAKEKEYEALIWAALMKATFGGSGSSSNKSSSSSFSNSYNNSKSSTPEKSKNHVYVCDDCGKVQVRDGEPYDKSTCPETRWGGIGGAGNIWDDGDHNYSDLGNSGSNQFVCNRCNIAIMLFEEPRYEGTCGASGSNCCNHRWE